jgi:nucleotide-binding universal stress UspA family protein
MRILIAIYGSTHDRAALYLGARLALRSGSPPTLLIINPTRPKRSAVPPHARDYLVDAGLKVEQLQRSGEPAEVIVGEATAGHCDLLIVGDGQTNGVLDRVRSTPISLRIIRYSPCPALIVKGESRPVLRILLCESGAESPSTGLRLNDGPSCFQRFTRQLASVFAQDAEITVLHVMSQMSAGPGVRGKQLRAEVEELIQEHTPEGELLQRDVQTLEHARLRTHAEVRHGLVIDEIRDEARSGDYDLVVIGAHRAQGWQRVLLEDLTHKLVLQLDRPVLVV